MSLLKFFFLNGLMILVFASCTPGLTQQPTATSWPDPLPAISEATHPATPLTETPAVQTPLPSITAETKAYVTLTGGDIDYTLVRNGPGANYIEVGRLKPGIKAPAVGQTEEADWIYIEFPGAPQGKGWVNAAFVKLAGGVLPVVDAKTGQVMTPGARADPQITQQIAVEVIKNYLKQDNLQYQYLGEGSNLNNFNHPNQRLERYQVGNTVYSVDPKSILIVEIEPQQPGPGHQTASGKPLTQVDLEQKARGLITRLAPQINLQSLVSEKDNKGDNYFFRWTDPSTLGFVQVGYSQDGHLLNYVNSIEAGK